MATYDIRDRQRSPGWHARQRSRRRHAGERGNLQPVPRPAATSAACGEEGHQPSGAELRRIHGERRTGRGRPGSPTPLAEAATWSSATMSHGRQRSRWMSSRVARTRPASTSGLDVSAIGHAAPRRLHADRVRSGPQWRPRGAAHRLQRQQHRLLKVQPPGQRALDPNNPLASTLDDPASAGLHELRFTVLLPYVAGGAPGAPAEAPERRLEASGPSIDANERSPQPITGNLGVALSRTATESTDGPVVLAVHS